VGFLPGTPAVRTGSAWSADHAWTCPVALGESAAKQALLHSTFCLVDRNVSVGGGARIRVGNGDSAKRAAADDVRALGVWHIRISERVICFIFFSLNVDPL
jgi:hypothetical protein